VCDVYETGLLLLFAYVAVSLLLLSFFLGVGAPSLSRAGFMFKAQAVTARFSLFVVASAAYVHEKGVLLLFAHVALLLLPLSFFLGVGAPSLSLGGFMFKASGRGSFSLLFYVASAACVLASLALIVLA